MAAFLFQGINDLRQCVEGLYCLLPDTRSDFYQHSKIAAWIFIVKVKSILKNEAT